MRIKNLFFLALVFAPIIVGANNALSLPVPSPIPSSSAGTLCNQVAPFNFHIAEVGTTWVRYTWGGNAAFEHRIRTYRASDNFLLSTDFVPVGTASKVVNGLPSGTEVYGVINAICPDGSNSSEEATCLRGTTLIVELIVQAFTAPNGGWNCQHTGSGSCSFSSDLNVYSYFKIYPTSNPSDFREFALKKHTASIDRAYIKNYNSVDQSPFDFKCNGSDPLPPSDKCQGPEILQIVVGTDIIGTFTTNQNVDSQVATFEYTEAPGVAISYTIENILPRPREGLSSGPSKGFIRERDETPSPSNHPATASPNPFSETLEVYLPSSCIIPAKVNSKIRSK